MLRLLLRWLLSALALVIVSYVVPGFYVSGFWGAMKAALAIGIINATLGLLLKIVTFPLTILTLGIFWFVVNAIVIELASTFVRGFHVANFFAAFIGAVALSLVNIVLHWLINPRD